ncbi:hypothetical protein PYW07_007004 [Mythimna separata]|uniref:Uncharacterized protein n=1 Tax=Mythimna separata TaxID=271217 RepID=A0AAD8DZK5_MYTSE|nr:hypothetical protein PYW07_007004 [Mythimna separata]
MQATIESELKKIMEQAPPSGTPGPEAAMQTVINDTAGLLVSYVMFQALKAEALDLLVKEMKDAGEGALLRHGPIRKSFKEGAALLDGKKTEDLVVSNADPVVARKIQIKLNNLMLGVTPARLDQLMNEVIAEATMFLAVHILQPKVFKVCKCYKNVFVQCELWCDEILRRVARPCCTCSRHVSVQALADLAPNDFLTVSSDNSHVLAPGVEISFKSCPAQARNLPPGEPLPLCPAPPPQTTSYLLYETTNRIYSSRDVGVQQQPPRSLTPTTSGSDGYTPKSRLSSESPIATSKLPPCPKPPMLDIQAGNSKYFLKQLEQLQYACTEESHSPTYSSSTSYEFEAESSYSKHSRDRSQQYSSSSHSQAKSGYSSRTPILSAEHMVDWDATMVSLLWNVLAWRDWIQEIVDHALSYQFPSLARGETSVSSWLSFYTRVTSEALQWRQYSVFSRQLTNRLHLCYRDKEIESPKRSSVETETYIQCQEVMLDIIEMFNRWTQWLTLVVKETDSLQQVTGSEVPLYQMRWNHLKMKVEGYSRDWDNYKKFLKVSWEQKYSAIIADFLPSWKKPGPVWVVSACGAVPSGAVAAGVSDGEVIWVARAMHRCTVLPATLMPSKHCCVVYAEGQVHSYNKYQVMCNAEVRWLAWRGGSIAERAVSVAPGMHVGRVHYHGDHLLGAVYEPDYHCHVVIFGRPFAFNCYELLMLANDDDHQ